MSYRSQGQAVREGHAGDEPTSPPVRFASAIRAGPHKGNLPTVCTEFSSLDSTALTNSTLFRNKQTHQTKRCRARVVYKYATKRTQNDHRYREIKGERKPPLNPTQPNPALLVSSRRETR